MLAEEINHDLMSTIGLSKPKGGAGTFSAVRLVLDHSKTRRLDMFVADTSHAMMSHGLRVLMLTREMAAHYTRWDIWRTVQAEREKIHRLSTSSPCGFVLWCSFVRSDYCCRVLMWPLKLSDCLFSFLEIPKYTFFITACMVIP